MADNEPNTGQQLRRRLALVAGLPWAVFGLAWIVALFVPAGSSAELRHVAERLLEICALPVVLVVWTVQLVREHRPRWERTAGICALALMAPLALAGIVLGVLDPRPLPRMTAAGLASLIALLVPAVVGFVIMCVVGMRQSRREKAKRRANAISGEEGSG